MIDTFIQLLVWGIAGGIIFFFGAFMGMMVTKYHAKARHCIWIDGEYYEVRQPDPELWELFD